MEFGESKSARSPSQPDLSPLRDQDRLRMNLERDWSDALDWFVENRWSKENVELLFDLFCCSEVDVRKAHDSHIDILQRLARVAFNELYCRSIGLSDPVDSRAAILAEILGQTAAFFTTCKRDNTDEWMQQAAGVLNSILPKISDCDRVEYDQRHGQIHLKKREGKPWKS